MRERWRLPSRYQWMRYVVSYPRLSRSTRRNGTPYLRFFGLDDLEAFLVTLAVFVALAAFLALPAFAILGARTTRFFPTLFPTALRPDLARRGAAGRFARVAGLDATGERALRTADR